MAVRVRMFAALREASGSEQLEIEPAALDLVLEGLCERYGEPFTSRLRCSTVLVDGTAVRPGTHLELRDGAEVALLPPVSGGGA